MQCMVADGVFLSLWPSDYLDLEREEGEGTRPGEIREILIWSHAQKTGGKEEVISSPPPAF